MFGDFVERKNEESELISFDIKRGVVENINDPELAGRIKVRIFGIHSDNPEYVKTEHLPWSIPATSIGGGSRGIGEFTVPPIGSHVFVFFEGGDYNFPVYFAAAPAIEDVEDYHGKGGLVKDGTFKKERDALDSEKKKTGANYEYEDSKISDDEKDYKKDEKEYKVDKRNEEAQTPVQDWHDATRRNIYGEGGEYKEETSLDNKTDKAEIFPEKFFKKEIRTAFDNKANHDAENYSGIDSLKPSNSDKDEEGIKLSEQELDKWDERKWGFNDDKTQGLSPKEKEVENDEGEKETVKEGGTEWKPSYPMSSVEMTPYGEIIDRDILKERKTYIHPSKYYVEMIQLDSERKKTDFENEQSIKRVYQRQRGIKSCPSEEFSSPKKVNFSGQSNQATPVTSSDSIENAKDNKIKYDDIEGEEREHEKGLSRFELRMHNPGRERSITEDFVYRFYMNKVNETYQSDYNKRIYVGNDNLEIEHGDVNKRLHKGSYNTHMDEGNVNSTLRKGWKHEHIDKGHHFREIGGVNQFETSGQKEVEGNPDFNQNQHEDLANGSGSDAEFSPVTRKENDIGNDTLYLHEGDRNVKIKEGNYHYQSEEGWHKIWLQKGSKTTHLQEGDNHVQVDSGNNKLTLLDGDNIATIVGDEIKSVSGNVSHTAGQTYTITASNIVLDGKVTITKTLGVGIMTTCPLFLGVCVASV